MDVMNSAEVLDLPQLVFYLSCANKALPPLIVGSYSGKIGLITLEALSGSVVSCAISLTLNANRNESNRQIR